MAKFARAAALAVLFLGITAIVAKYWRHEPIAAINLVPIIIGFGGLGLARFLDV